MLARLSFLVLSACLVSGAAGAANAPFVGEWKLNPSKSTLVDEMNVKSMGGNKYVFDFGDGPEPVVVDGTDQPGSDGTTLSVAAKSENAWTVVRKQNGRMLLSANWALASDGKTLTDDFTSIGPDGKGSNVKYVYQRTAGTSGFAGTWDSKSVAVNFVYVLKIGPYEGDGLSITSSTSGVTTKVRFDGKDYPHEGLNAQKGSTSSARRMDPHTIELTDKTNGKAALTRLMTLSSDLKILTMTLRAGRRTPNILVLERQ